MIGLRSDVLMDYVVEEKESREKPKAVYFWLPGLFSFLLVAGLVLGRLFTEDVEKFLSWNGVLTWCVVGVIVFFGGCG